MITAVGAVVAALAFASACSALVMRRVNAPTTGTAIDRNARSASALLVIDLQTDFVDGNGYDQDEVDRVLQRINARAAAARADGAPVATLRQVYRGLVATTVIRLVGKGLGTPGSTGLGLHVDVDVDADVDVVKSRLDGFSNPALGAWLADNEVRELEIVGLDGCYCVKATAIGALNRGFDVRLDDELILAGDQAAWQATQQHLLAAGAVVLPERPKPHRT